LALNFNKLKLIWKILKIMQFKSFFIWSISV
jgi:hypothetical protein